MKSTEHRSDYLKFLALALGAAAGLVAGSAQALTTTSVIDLGAFESGGTFFDGGALEKKVDLGSLPAGSILRSVTMNYRLALGDPYLGDLIVLFADDSGDNGIMKIKGNSLDSEGPKGASSSVVWNSGSDYNVGVTATQTLVAADGILPFDLHNYAVWLETGYPGTWEGSVTLEYDVPEPALIFSFGPGAVIGTLASNAAPVAWTVPYGTDVTTLAPTFTLSSGACDKDNGGPTTYDFTNPVVYTVTDGATVNTYTVTVTVAPDETTLIWGVANGIWDFSTSNWKGQTSGVSTIFFNGKNVIFDNTSGGAISISPGVVPLSTTVSATSGTYTFSGAPLGGTGSLTKDGGGTLVNNDWNTYSGGTIITNGTLQLNWPGDANPKTSLGSGPVTLNGGLLKLNRNLLANELTVNGGSMFLDNGFGNTLTGAIILNVDLNVTAQYSNHPLSGDISGAGGITMTSSAGGGLILSGTNTYAGPTSVTGGTLRCDSPAAVAPGALSISSGGAKVNLNYGGTKTIASLTLGGAAQTLPGTYGSMASSALYPNDGYFVGTGTVTIGGGSAYDSWAGGPFLGTLTDPTSSLDFDGGSLATGIEWVVGGDPTNPGDDASLTPTSTTDGTYLIFTYKRTNAANSDPNTAIKAQYGTTLATWNDALNGVDGVVIEVMPGSPAATVVVKIPKTLAAPGSELFARLNVVVTTP